MDDLKKFNLDDTEYETRLSYKFLRRKPYVPENPRLVQAEIPGVIQALLVKPGQKVKRGETLVVLEAMKMKNPIVAPRDGIVRAVVVSPGQMVAKGQLMVEFE